MDPLSITAGVATLLGCCITVSMSLRKFMIGAAEAKTSITAMMADVRALRTVLEAMEITFDEMNSDKREVGHIGVHWTNLLQSLEDGQQSLTELYQVLEDANKNVKVLDSARKQLRIKAVSDKIVTCRQEVQTYKDALQLSLQTVTLWKAHDIKGTTEEVLATSQATHKDLQRLATNVDIKLTALQSLFEISNHASGVTKLANLKKTVASAATVIAGENNDVANLEEVDDVMSDFGDWFRSEASQNTLDWIYNEKRHDPLFTLEDPDFRATAAHTARNTTSNLVQNTRRNDETLRGSQKAIDASMIQLRIDGRSEDADSTPKQKTSEDQSPHSYQTISHAESTAQVSLQPPTVDIAPKPTQKQRQRRFSWFRSSKSGSSLTVRSPMIKDTPTISSIWRKAKLPRKLKIVFVGDGARGKTCLLSILTNGSFPEVCMPTVFDNYTADYQLDGQDFEVHFWDTAGQEDYDRLRPLSYPNADAVVIVFSIESPDSLDNVREKWISEVLHFCPGVPRFLVGCKKDLRHDPETINQLRKTSQAPVPFEEAEETRKAIGALTYSETSARTGEGTYEALNTVLSETVKYQTEQASQKRYRKK